ncbi:hypothetical protein PENTCL1PPCAC_1653, partial [Pristionchus entomophagus]
NSIPLSHCRDGMARALPVPELDDPLKYETYLFDADGVLWRSNDPVPGAIRFINELMERGKRVYIVTNNSTKTTSEYTRKVTTLGFAKINEENIISPNVVMVDYFRRNPDLMSKSVYTIASSGVVQTLRKELKVETFGDGPDPVHPSISSPSYPVDIHLREVSAVVVGFDVHFSYTKIMKAANYLRDPLCGFIITNEDSSFPGPKNIVVPGTGCLTASIRVCSLPRVPVVMGKPGEEMERYLRGIIDVHPEKTVLFGDRLDTDMMMGNRLGVVTCWLRTGVNAQDDVERAVKE